MANDFSNVFIFLYDFAETDSTVTCDNEDSAFLLENATEDYDRPHKRFHSQDTTETTIEMGYQSSIDTIFLGNCNFDSFKIEISGVQYDFTTVMDIDTGIYNAVIRLDSASPIASFKIIIPAQTPNSGESFFAIGVILACIRKDLTMGPHYPLRKTVEEPTVMMRFDKQNSEMQEIGRAFHVLELNWNQLSNMNLAQLEDAVRVVGQDGIVAIYEKRDAYEASYLCQMLGGFSTSRGKSRYHAPLSYRELT
jgi:hypothetical protein